MAYGQKYKLEYTDLDDNEYIIIISKEGYTGDVINYIGASDPIVMKLDKSGDDRFEPLKPTSMNIGIFVEEEGDYDEFYEIDNFEYRVDKYLNTVLDWSGYINDEIFTEPISDGKYIVNLTATDGMSILKGRYTELTGRHTHFDMIQECMDAIGLGLNIVDSIGIREMNHTDGGPLMQTMFDASIFTKDKTRWTLEEVLRDILRTYGACVSQVHGKWVITNVEAFHDGISGWEYTDDSTVVGAYTDTDEKHIESTLAANIITLLTGGQKQKNKGWRELRVKRNFGKSQETLVQNGNFSQTEEHILASPISSTTNRILCWHPINEPTAWLGSNEFLKTQPETGSFLFLPQGSFWAVENDRSRYVGVDLENTYVFSAKFALLQNDNGSGSGRKWKTQFEIIVTESPGEHWDWWLTIDNETGEASWSEVPTQILLDNGGDLIDQQNENDFKWIQIPPIKIEGFPGGKVIVRLYNIEKTGIVLSYTGVAWDDVLFYCEASNSQSGNGVLIGMPTDNKFTEIPEEIEFTQNDILTENAEFFYNNYLSLLDGTLTTSWVSAHHSGTLADIYLLSVIEAHGRSVQVKTIPGRGLITPHTRLIDHNGKKFQIISYSHNDKTNQFSCEAVEIIEPGTIDITSNVVMESSSSGGGAGGGGTEPDPGTGSTDDRLVSMLDLTGFESGLPGRLHGNYFMMDFIQTKPVYIPKRLSTLKTGYAFYTKGVHTVTFGTAYLESYIVKPYGSTGTVAFLPIITDRTHLDYFVMNVPVAGYVSWEAYVIDNT